MWYESPSLIFLKGKQRDDFSARAYIETYNLVQPIYRYRHGAHVKTLKSIHVCINSIFSNEDNRVCTIRQHPKGRLF